MGGGVVEPRLVGGSARLGGRYGGGVAGGEGVLEVVGGGVGGNGGSLAGDGWALGVGGRVPCGGGGAL